MLNKTFLTILGIAGMATAIVAFQSQAPPLPSPYATESVNNGPKVIPQPAGATLHAPAGFDVSVFAEGFSRPRFMLMGSSGFLLADSLGRGEGSVYVIPYKQGDTKATGERHKLIEGLDRPYGLAVWKDYLYVAETTSLKRYKYDAKAMNVLGKGEEVVPMPQFGMGHWTRTVLFDREGKKMYLTIGSGSNVATGEAPERAAINRYNPDGSEHEIYASGLRNVIGLRWFPNSDTLWAATQERDALGDAIPPDYFTHVQQGGFYGWPYAYFGPHEDPRHKGDRPDLVDKTIPGDVPLGAHVAVLDFIFYTGKQFPAEYQDGALLAFHGSWNSAVRVGYKLAFIPFKNGKPAGGPKDFVTGFMLAPDKREVWGRPVGLLQLPDGSVLFSDDGGNKLWRVSYKR